MRTVSTQLKKLDDGLVFLNSKLKNLECNDEIDSNEYKLVSKKIRALNEILEYVNTYNWVSHKVVIDKIKFIRFCEYNYDEIQRELGLSEASLKSFMYRINKSLNSKIGENTIKMILSDKDNWSDGLMQFRILSGVYDLSDVMVPECYSQLPEKKFSTYSLKECMAEIDFIYKYSNQGIKDAIGQLDMNKLAFLRYILESETDKYRQEQKDLTLVLQGTNISYDEFIEKVNNKYEVDIGL